MIKLIRNIRQYFIHRRFTNGKVNNISILKPRVLNFLKENVCIGKNFFAGPGFYLSINKYCKLSIGDAVMFGPDVMILGGNHNYGYSQLHLRYYTFDDENTKNIIVEDGVWVGARTVILSGAYIGEGCVVGAGSIVNKYIPPYTIAVGSPAKSIKCRFSNKNDLMEILKNTQSKYLYEELMDIYKKYNIQNNY